MVATTVNGKLVNPAGATPARGSVTFQLVDYNDNPIIGFDSTDQTEIVSAYAVTPAVDGTWTVQLTPNAAIQLAGGVAPTAWRVIESGAGAGGTYWIVVPTGGPFWVGTLRTILAGATFPNPITGLVISGALSVGGTLTLDGTLLAAPPNDSSKFLAGDGTWRVGGGAVSSVNGHTGAVVLASADVGAVPTTAEGAAGGVATLDGSALLTPAQVPMALIRTNRLDQFAAPTSDVAMGGHKLTGGAPGTASTDFLTVSQLPAPSRDRRSAMLGLLGQPFDFGDINDTGLGLTTGFLILMLCQPDAGTGAYLDLWLGNAGSGATGVANVCAFTEDGSSRIGLSGDVTAQLSNVANADSVLKLPFASSFAVDGLTSLYLGVFCQMSTNPTIGGIFASLHPRTVNGHRPAIVIGGLSSVPPTINVAGATTAGAAYWFGLSP